MSSSAPQSANVSDEVPASQASAAANQATNAPEAASEKDEHTHNNPLPLPAPEEGEAKQLNVGGEGIKLDHLGPLVVNKDGTLSRISNWDKMSEIEKKNTLRVLGKRNQLRMDNLKAQEEEQK